jgi:hypothetical protein
MMVGVPLERRLVERVARNPEDPSFVVVEPDGDVRRVCGGGHESSSCKALASAFSPAMAPFLDRPRANTPPGFL